MTIGFLGNTRRGMNISAIAAFAVLVLPLMYVCLFANPQNDDFRFAEKASEFGYIGKNLFWYDRWIGRFASTAILTMNLPGIDLVMASKLCSALVVISLFMAVFLFLYSIFFEAYSPLKIFFATTVMFSIYVSKVPDITQGFYWMAGSVTYQVGNIFMLAIFGVLILLKKSSDKKKLRVYGFISFVLVFVASGTNEVTMLIILSFALALCVCGFITGQDVKMFLPTVLVPSIIAVAIVLYAPGTRIRMNYSKNQELYKVVQEIMADVAASLADWLLFSPIIPVAILALPLLARISNGKKLIPFCIKPHVSLTLSVVLTVAMFFPSYFSTGLLEPRTKNVIFMLFLILCVLNLFVMADNVAVDQVNTIKKVPTILLLVASFTLFVISDINYRNLYEDILTGKASRYDLEMRERAKIIRECVKNACYVPAITNKPKTLFFFEDAFDLENDDKSVYGYKLGYAAYYNKELIFTK